MRSRFVRAVAALAALVFVPSAQAAPYRAVLIPNPAGGAYRVNAVDGERPVGNVNAIPHAAIFAPDFSSYVDLHPAGASVSSTFGAGGGQQVGAVDDLPALWSGTAGSVVYLRPDGATGASANDTNGTRQVGSAQGGPFGTNHAILWNGSAGDFVDLHPAGYASSGAGGIDAAGGRQVGGGAPVGNEARQSHALLWRGTAASVVDLHPAGYYHSSALAIAGDQVVGSATPNLSPAVPNRAALWDLATGEFTELHPAEGYRQSHASRTNGDLQLGIGITPTGRQHALLWDDTADSLINLHQLLGPEFERSSVAGFDSAGNVYGNAFRFNASFQPVRWEVVPEPTGLSAIVAIGATLIARRRVRFARP